MNSQNGEENVKGQEAERNRPDLVGFINDNKIEFRFLLGLTAVVSLGLFFLHLRQPLGWRVQNFVDQFNYRSVIETVSLIFLVFLIELYTLGWKGSFIYKLTHRFNLSAKTDLFVSLIYYLNFATLVAALFSFGTTKIVPRFVDNLINVDLLQGVPNHFLQIIIFLIVADFLSYCYHRISHEVQFLWELHKYHHSATDFLVVTGGREHPVEHAIEILFDLIPLAILGAYAQDFVIVLLLKRFHSIIVHSMVDWKFGWIGQWLIYSPVGHRIHHSKEFEHWDKNYGSVFVIWDRIFGTFYTGKNINKEVGLSDNPFNKKSVIYDLYLPLALSMRSLSESVRTGKWKAVHRRQENIDKYRRLHSDP